MGELVGLVSGAGFASGLSLYATVFLLGLAGRFLGATPVPDELTSTGVLVVAAILTLLEFVADKVPWLDSVWDGIHTIVRPLGAAWLGVVLVDGQPLFSDSAAAAAAAAEGGSGGVAAGLLSAVLASIAHGAKASTRVAVNASPEPVSNPVVSLAEDGLVGVLVYVSLAHPLLALVVVGVLVVVSVGVVVGLWRSLRRVLRRRRQRHDAGVP